MFFSPRWNKRTPEPPSLKKQVVNGYLDDLKVTTVHDLVTDQNIPPKRMKDSWLNITPRTFGRSPFSSPVCVKGVNRFMKTKGSLVPCSTRRNGLFTKDIIRPLWKQRFHQWLLHAYVYELFWPVILLSLNCHP